MHTKEALDVTRKTDFEFIQDYAKDQSDKPAIIFAGERMSYSHLWKSITGLCAYLKAGGVKAGDAVIIKSKRANSFVVAFYAIQLAGGTAVILAEHMGEGEVHGIAKKHGVRLIVSDGFEGRDNDIRYILHADIAGIAEAHSLTEIPAWPGRDDISEVVFSSGTTGEAKGVMFSYENTACVADMFIEYQRLDSSCTTIVSNSLESVAGLRQLHMMVRVGGSLVIANSMINTAHYFGLIDAHNVNRMFITSALIEVMFEVAPEQFAALKDQIKVIESGTASLPERSRQMMREVLPNTMLISLYGSTEGGNISFIEYSLDTHKKGSSGRLRRNVHVRLVDDEMLDVDAGKTGHILVKSDSITPGYWNAPALTSKSFHEGWLMTRDLGYFDSDGYIYVIGRQDDTLIVSGFKFAPTMIEDLAMSTGFLKECLCVPFDDSNGGLEGLKLLIVPVKNRPVATKRELLREMKNHLNEISDENRLLAKEALARIFTTEVIDRVPRTARGKIDRKAAVSMK